MVPSTSMKLSTMASIINGEIPVVVIYVKPNNTPSEYKMLSPDEAILTLAAIERLRDTRQSEEKELPAKVPAAANAGEQQEEGLDEPK
jgi:hypothetical protein